jgi:hypothetical protein
MAVGTMVNDLSYSPAVFTIGACRVAQLLGEVFPLLAERILFQIFFSER